MKTKVYFNNSCSICRTEINEYKKHSKDKIEWVDISTYKDSESETNKKTDELYRSCLLYTSPSPRDRQKSRMPSSA